MRVYVTGGFRTVEGMAAAVRDRAADGIGLARPTTAEFDLANSILEGRVNSTADSKIDESNFLKWSIACGAQIRQASKTSLEQANGNLNL